MTKLFSAVWHFWTVPVRAERMAAFRILIGTLVAIDTTLTILPHAEWYLGAEGLNPAALYQLTREPGSWSLIPAGATDLQIHIVVVGLIVAAACVAFGFATRVASIAMWALLVSAHQRSPIILNGGDFLLQAAAFYLVFMPSGAAWSIDQRIRRGRGIEASLWVPPWPLRLAQIQLAVMYLFTGLSKLPVAGAPGPGHWASGDAIAGALGTATMGRFEFLTWLPWWFFAPVVWLTMAWELSFPALVVFERSRYAALAFGVLLHLGIFATLEVGIFSFATLCYYVLFLPAAWFGPPHWTPEAARGPDDA